NLVIKKRCAVLVMILVGAGAVGACSSATSASPASSSAGPVTIDQATCKTVCDRIATAQCPKDDPGTCEAGCAKVPSIIPTACTAEGKAFVACASSAQTWTCDAASGYAGPNGCDAQTSALATCIQKNAEPSTSGGG